ncbi:hypothetical protein L6452_33761 [Arctium lappa]|uniref:Uncharacterized protein n=1 Tax=Arctium lappa TaxID=4217 RepID=A0ACB8YGZ4_ARCLA|nr:hypothetical protein L6452_33761 [Arctium lappa]
MPKISVFSVLEEAVKLLEMLSFFWSFHRCDLLISCESSVNISVFVSEEKMASTEQQQPKLATEEAKIDLFEDDDEFEEFDINRVWDGKEEGKGVGQQWEDDWDDDDVNDDFSLQLKRELENNADIKK